MRHLLLLLIFATGCKTESLLTLQQKQEFLKSKGYTVLSRKGTVYTVYQKGHTVAVKVNNDLQIEFQ